MNCIRNKLTKMINYSPKISDVKYKIVNEDKNNYFITNYIQYKSDENDIIPAYYLVPNKKPPFPAILLYHQHNSQWHIGKSEAMGLTGDPYQAFAPKFAELGFAVIIPDHIGFEERRPEYLLGDKTYQNNWLNWYNLMAYNLIRNELILTKILKDCDLALSILLKDKRIIKNNISLFGHSMGGNIGIFHSALNTDIKNICISGAVCSYKEKIKNHTGIEMTMVIPGIIKYDMIEILKCIIPRKLYIVASKDDKVTKDSNEIYDKIKVLYEIEPNKKNISYNNFDGGHQLDDTRFNSIINWFNKLL